MSNRIVVILFLSMAFISCRKDVLKPVPLAADPVSGIRYIDLGEQEARPKKSKSIDLDGDGKVDFSFSTLLVGDPILRHDKLQFYVYSRVGTYLLSNEQDQSPVLNKEEAIDLEVPDFNWYEISAIVLTEKVIVEKGPVQWKGLWKEADHKYLPVQIRKSNQYFTGWIELSFDIHYERIILHRAAINTIPNRSITAGI
jgi:hypothetical protein